MASTPNVLAISGTETSVFLKCITEMREDTKTMNRGEPSDKFLCHTVGKVSLGWIFAQVF